MDKRKKPELLMPAGSPEVLRTAVKYGADAVYIGGEAFSLRSGARNFSIPEIKEAVEYSHERNVRVFVTANILAHNRDFPEIREYFKKLSETDIDAVLVADPGVFLEAKNLLPENIELHISTQANNTNYQTFRFWHSLGAKRVVCARELSLSEIREIRENVPADLEIEAFVHGAMCISYSGRCLLSNFFTGRDSNRGECTHPCRWKYTLMEETRPGEYFPVFENDRGSYIFNSKDLSMIEHIPELVECGIDSFKIEGRMKTALYVASTARAYRTAIDDYFSDPETYREKLEYYKKEIGKCTNRDFTTGFYFGKPGDKEQIYSASTYRTGAVYLGTVRETDSEGYCYFEQKNKFLQGQNIEIMGKSENILARVLEIRNALTNEEMPSCPHAREELKVKLSMLPEKEAVLRTLD